ncbi:MULTISPECIES: MGH1-like glycoside hydrolase domain-containing protein [Alteromonas]|jgi:glycogen debranching enzyme|uniref:Trehalase family glycosidase n=1 Tax=Alteromonas stellipolaris TaxID=233316 RepID=A0AAW7Z327_9ALTE|nr:MULTISPECIES: trehalase family glycosidase [Alteromonas]AMJ91774.1 hypothetical protein AV940_15550 [Alteromonas sp. Mac2]ALM89378.1 hypothetical protein AOR13_326 [Alteromonas stellipolaris LMG 21856]AMJ75485.1 hypothetical protein AVL57_16855 [Alteromonas stellipolaris]AMJ87909.1 hypothetical protein AV939_15795 [Alteromonas sp. Mac1]MDO6578856.1 trehalase family glycosidase [Alteromonas stellipolaris]
MTTIATQTDDQLIADAKATLIKNDLGGYTVPTHGLYPFQWNWDSAIVALGWLPFDEPRAWEETTSLLSAQWKNGMVPHVVFHQHSDTYFPGPDIWGVKNNPDSTSITQPPVLATVIRQLFEQTKDRALVDSQISQIVQQLIDYHLWWYKQRDPEYTGLVVSYHPWESGMDNSPAWDDALRAVPKVGWEYTRRDINHIDASERPHKEEYDRFLYLVDFFRKMNFDDTLIYQDCPYRVNDVSIISILHRGTKDLLALCETLNIDNKQTAYLAHRMDLTEAAIGKLWSGETSMFHSFDTRSGKLCGARTNAGLLPFFAGLVNENLMPKLIDVLDDWLADQPFAISSTHPEDPCYEPQRYWRGPIWLHINWMITLGLEDYGFFKQAKQVTDASRNLIYTSGFNESFHAETGARSGGADFSWTAAMALYWLLPNQE